MADLTIHIPDKTVRTAGLLLSGILLTWAFFALLSSGAFRPKYELHIFVPDSEGLRVGAPVLLNGMTVGRVSRVEPANNSTDTNRSIAVTLRIEKRFHDSIRSESVAHLSNMGLLGDHFVNIQRGVAGAPIKPGGEIRFAPSKELTAADFINLLGKARDCAKEEKNSADNKSQTSTDKSTTAK